MRKSLCYFVLAVSLFAIATVSQASTLRDELTGLLRSHPRLQAERDRVDAAAQQVRRAFADYLPRVALTGDVGPEYVDSPAQTEANRLNRHKTTLSLTQNIFDGFRTSENHDSSVLRGVAARQRLDATLQALLLEGVTAYYDVLRQSRLIKIARANERAIRTQLRLEDERVQRGGGIAVDALLAKTRLQLARERTEQLVGALSEARARYLQVFGHPAVSAEMTYPDFKLSRLPDNVDHAASISTEVNPALQVSKTEVEIGQRTIGVAKADFFPRVDIVAQANRENDVDAVKGVRRDWSVLLRATWEIFSGNATVANVASAAKDSAATKNNYLFNRRKIDEELRIVWHQLATARKRVKLLENAVVIAQEVFRARRRLRDAGKETAINVLDAQTELFNAQINSIAANFDAEVATYRVLHAMGKLTPKELGIHAASIR